MIAKRKKEINDINDLIRMPPVLVQKYFSGYKIFNFEERYSKKCQKNCQLLKR
jgi:hypothetical protein